MNRGRFKNFDQVLYPQGRKPRPNIPKLYRDREYDKILQHIKDKAATIIHGYQFVLENLPNLTSDLQKYLQQSTNKTQ